MGSTSIFQTEAKAFCAAPSSGPGSNEAAAIEEEPPVRLHDADLRAPFDAQLVQIDQQERKNLELEERKGR